MNIRGVKQSLNTGQMPYLTIQWTKKCPLLTRTLFKLYSDDFVNHTVDDSLDLGKKTLEDCMVFCVWNQVFGLFEKYEAAF